MPRGQARPANGCTQIAKSTLISFPHRQAPQTWQKTEKSVCYRVVWWKCCDCHSNISSLLRGCSQQLCWAAAMCEGVAGTGRAAEILCDLPRSSSLTHEDEADEVPKASALLASCWENKNDWKWFMHWGRAGLFDFIDNNNILAMLITSSN